MAYKVMTEGMEELIQAMDQLGEAGRGAAAMGLYEAAGVYADEVSRAVHGIATEPFQYAAGGRKRQPSPEEKAALQDAIGIAKFDKNGLSVNTGIGYAKAGYVVVGGTRSKKGRTNYRADLKTGRVMHASQAGKGSVNVKPIALIANAINKGTSFMKAQPYFRKATARANGKAEAAFAAKAIEVLEKVIKGN